MPMLRTIERPTKATLRPYSWAASRICWMRWMWLAKLATMIRLRALPKTCRRTLEMSFSGGTKPGTSAFVESERRRSMPSSLNRANACRSVRRPSSGSWSILKSPVWTTMPHGRTDGDRQGVGDGVVDRDELAVEGTDALAVPLRHLEGVGPDAVLLELGLDEREGQLGADQWDVRLLAEEEGNATDVVLVAMGEDDALDVVEAVPDGREVRQDQVDSGLLLFREEHPAVDDQQAAAVFEDRHVSADLAETTEWGDPQGAFGERRGRGQFRMRMTQKTLLTTHAMYRWGTWRA